MSDERTADGAPGPSEARPPDGGPGSKRRARRVTAQFTSAEHEALREFSRRRKVSPSEYVREATLCQFAEERRATLDEKPERP